MTANSKGRSGGDRPTPKTCDSRNPTDNSASSQRTRLVEHLQEHGSITTIEARHNLDIMHPAGRIDELRAQGYKIDTVWTNDTTEQGKQHRVARYVWRAAS